MIRRALHAQMLVPVWFVGAGAVAAWLPASSAPVAIILLVLIVGVVPILWSAWPQQME